MLNQKSREMKKLSIIVGLALVMLTAACSKDATSDINPSLKTLLGVNIDNSQSRTYIGEAEADGTYPVLWSAGDKVLVNGEAVAVADEFVGKNNLTLEVAAAAEYKMAYPAELIEGDVLTISEVQKFVEGSFAVGSGVLVGYSKTEDIMLKNLYGYLKFTVANAADVNRVTVVATGGEALSGTYAINFEAATIAPLAGKDLIRVTDVVAANGVATVVVAVPAGDYSKGFTVKVADKTNGVMTKSLKAAGATVEAGVVYAMPQLTYAATATETLICSAADLQAFIAAANGGDFSAYVSADGQVKLGADIDLTGVVLDQIVSWPAEAVLNGQGFALKNWATADALVLENYGTVKNIVVDKSCDINYNLNAATKVHGILVAANLGVVSGCVNNADIIVNDPNLSFSGNRFIGSIVGCISAVLGDDGDPDNDISSSSVVYAGARVDNCVNNGNISITAKTYTTTGWMYIGGVAGTYLQHIEAGQGGIFNSVNNGDISLKMNPTDKRVVHIGGVIGTAGKEYLTESNNSLVSYCLVENCINNGNITNYTVLTGNKLYMGGITAAAHANLTACTNNGVVAIQSGTSASLNSEPYIGGIAGIFSGNITSCHNNGNIEFNNSDLGYNFYVGGIAGRSVNATANRIAIKDCSNSGKLDLRYKCNSGRKPYAGGIVGYTKSSAGSVDITNAQNSGDIHFELTGGSTGVQRPMIGGINGSIDKTTDATYKNVVNKGTITVKSKLLNETCIGGICGQNYVNLENCQSLGDIKLEIADGSTGKICVGGFGCRLNGSATSWNGCVVDCDFTFSEGASFGLLQGDYWGSATSLTVGDKAPVVIKSTTTVNGVAVTEEYMRSHLLGVDQKSSNVFATEANAKGIVLE